MKQTIQDFYRVAGERDFTRDFQFRIVGITSRNIAITEDDLVYAKGGELPARTIENHTAPYMGLDFNVPGAVKYPGSMSLEFYCDNASITRQLFENWSINIFDDNISGGDYAVPDSSQVLTMSQLDPQFRTVSTYKLYGIYPQETGSLAYDITGAGAPLSFNVTLQYHYWRRVGQPTAELRGI